MSSNQEQSRGLLSVLPKWIQMIIGLVTIGGFVVAALKFFNPIGKVDLSVWIQQEIPITLPAEVDSLPLILKYKDENIRRATVLTINISNSSSTPFGEKEKWPLTLRTEDHSKIILLANPKARPANLEVKVLDGTAPDILSLQIGLFRPC